MNPPEDPQAEWKRIKELFAEASELPESKQRDFLEAQCPDEPDLVAQVLQLLVQDRAASRHFLESPFDPVGTSPVIFSDDSSSSNGGRFLDPLYTSLATSKSDSVIHLGFRCARTKTL